MDRHTDMQPAAWTGCRLLSLFTAWALGFFLSAGAAGAASFDIQPINISFDAKARAEKLMIRNVSDDDLSLQVKAFKWSQDGEGRDIYEDTPEIVIFPKVLNVPKGEERIIRVGTTVRPAMLEGTYRVYVEELPIDKAPADGVGLRIAMKVGVPIFINPQKSSARAVLESFTVRNGKAAFRVKNDGNVHFIITSLKLTGRNERGAEVFSRELGGWYLLGGAARTYETDIPGRVCTGLTRLTVSVKTTRSSIQEDLDVTGNMCNTKGRQ